MSAMRNDTDSATALSVAEIVARRDHLLGKGTTLFYDPPLHLVRGEGAFVWRTASPPSTRSLDSH